MPPRSVVTPGPQGHQTLAAVALPSRRRRRGRRRRRRPSSIDQTRASASVTVRLHGRRGCMRAANWGALLPAKASLPIVAADAAAGVTHPRTGQGGSDNGITTAAFRHCRYKGVRPPPLPPPRAATAASGTVRRNARRPSATQTGRCGPLTAAAAGPPQVTPLPPPNPPHGRALTPSRTAFICGGPHTAAMSRRVGMSSLAEVTTARGGGSAGGGGRAKAQNAACRVPAGWQRRHSDGRPLQHRHPPVRRSCSLAADRRRVHHDGSAAPRRRRARRQPQERPAAPLSVSGQPPGSEVAA